MATGILGQADLAAATDTTLYTVPALFKDSFSVSFCNRTAAAITIRLSISALAAPANSEYFIYELSLPANSSFERSGLVAQAGKLVVVRASAIGISCSAYGYEGAA